MDQKVSTLFYPRKPRSHEKRKDMPAYTRITVKKIVPRRTGLILVPVNRWIEPSGYPPLTGWVGEPPDDPGLKQ